MKPRGPFARFITQPVVARNDSKLPKIPSSPPSGTLAPPGLQLKLPLLALARASGLTGITRSELRRLVREGRIRSVKIGCGVYFSEPQLHDDLALNYQAAVGFVIR